MEYQYLGRSGLKVSRLSVRVGNWDVSQGFEAAIALKAIRGKGINFFDVWNGRGSFDAGLDNTARIMGIVIVENAWKRYDFIVSIHVCGLSRKNLLDNTQHYLKLMGLDSVDLLYLHTTPDSIIPMDETIKGVNTLIELGLVHYWGTCDWSIEQMNHAFESVKRLQLVGPIAAQAKYNMFEREKVDNDEWYSLYEDNGIGLLTTDALHDNIFHLKDEPQFSTAPPPPKPRGEDGKQLPISDLHKLWKVKMLKPIADKLDRTRSHLAFAWCLANKNVVSTNIGYAFIDDMEVNSRVNMLGVIRQLTPEIMEQIEQVLDNKP